MNETPLQAGDTDRKLREKVKELIRIHDTMRPLGSGQTEKELSENAHRYTILIDELRKLVE